MNTKDYSYLIDEHCTTKATNENVRLSIPVLIYWAQHGGVVHTYGELSKAIGKPKGFSGIGHPLGKIKDIFFDLSKQFGKKIPTLNALATSKGKGIPSKGFDWVDSYYNNRSPRGEKQITDRLNRKAAEYQDWDWVLKVLRLKPFKSQTSANEKAILSGKHYGKGGEGNEHRRLKEYIYNHPKVIGLQDVVYKDIEHVLLSADRIDVYFELKSGEHLAVEVKPSSSSQDDILRGIYQCVKYRAILDAQDYAHKERAVNKSILVLGGDLGDENEAVRAAFGLETYVDVKG